MKYFLYAILISILFVSCKNDKNAATRNLTIQSRSVDSQTQALINKFKPIIQGVWVKKAYIEKIIATKSPLAAMDVADDIITMDINTDSIKGDSIIVLHGNTHEGSQFTLKFHPGTTANAISFDDAELSYSIENGDTILSFSRRTGQNNKVITTKYLRALARKQNDYLGSGIDYLINKNLIAGTYLLTDSAGNNSKVTFTNDGGVSGFLNCSKYEVNFDLDSDPMDNLDEIIFDIRTKNHKTFSFKVDNDTLGLYTEYPNSDSTELILGKRIYKLVKQH